MAALGCVLAGALVLGAGSRLVMRITTMIAEPGSVGIETRGGNTIGRVTIGGSIGLVWIGALGGLLFAGLYLVARRWLPRQTSVRGLWVGLMAMGVFGAFLVGDGSDFRFANPAAQLSMYAAMFLLFGLVATRWAERLGHGLPEPRPTRVGYSVVGPATVLGLATVVQPVADLLG